MQIHFIVHEVFEAPGAYLRWRRRAATVSAGRGYMREMRSRKTPTPLICWLCSAARSRRAPH